MFISFEYFAAKAALHPLRLPKSKLLHVHTHITVRRHRVPSRREIILGLVAATASMWSSLPLQAVEGEASESVEPRKACILVWLDGGPSTIDMWNLPSDRRTRGPFGTIPTAGEMEINEHLSKTADVMDELSIVRSMSTREVTRARILLCPYRFCSQPKCAAPQCRCGHCSAPRRHPQRPEATQLRFHQRLKSGCRISGPEVLSVRGR